VSDDPSDPPKRPPGGSRKGIPNKVSHQVTISDKTMRMLKAYCQLHNTQIRSELDLLLQEAILHRTKGQP
jgi:hypothetical protein